MNDVLTGRTISRTVDGGGDTTEIVSGEETKRAQLYSTGTSGTEDMSVIVECQWISIASLDKDSQLCDECRVLV